jgi:hypothetical protein
MRKVDFSAAAASLLALATRSENRVFGFENIQRSLQRRGRSWLHKRDNSIAGKNRHTGQPHEHKREIARRARQAAA